MIFVDTSATKKWSIRIAKVICNSGFIILCLARFAGNNASRRLFKSTIPSAAGSRILSEVAPLGAAGCPQTVTYVRKLQNGLFPVPAFLPFHLEWKYFLYYGRKPESTNGLLASSDGLEAYSLASLGVTNRRRQRQR